MSDLTIFFNLTFSFRTQTAASQNSVRNKKFKLKKIVKSELRDREVKC